MEQRLPIPGAVLFLHNVILYITKTYRVVVVQVACDITRYGVSFFSINFRIQKLLSIQNISGSFDYFDTVIV